MTEAQDRFAGTENDAVAARLAATRRRRVWQIVIGAHAVALIAAIVGCLFMMKSQGVQADVARMRDEVGETLTMMSLGGVGEAVAKHLPRLIDTTARWDRAFAAKRESFRGMDVEINQVQAMHNLGAMAEEPEGAGRGRAEEVAEPHAREGRIGMDAGYVEGVLVRDETRRHLASRHLRADGRACEGRARHRPARHR